MNKVFEKLFQDFKQVGQQATQGFTESPPTLDWLDKLSDVQRAKLIGTYTVNAVERMAASRGLNVENLKKQYMVTEVARRFYDGGSLTRIINGLSPAGREGLLRIQQAGGSLKLSSWQAQMQDKYGRARMEQVQAELIGNMLAFYGERYSANHIEFQTSPRRHEVTAHGFAGSNVVLWTYPKVLSLLKANADELKALQNQNTPQPYKPQPTKVAYEASLDALLADIFAFMRYLEQNKVKILQSGDIGKRDYTKLNELMTIKEDKATLTNAKKLSDLGRLNFIWRLLVETGLVKAELYEEVKLNPTNNDEFYALPRYRQARLLTAAWLRSSFDDFMRVPSLNFYNNGPNDYNDIPSHPQLVQARTFVITLLENLTQQRLLSDQQWLNFKTLLTLIQDRNPDFLMIQRVSQRDDYYYYSYRYYEGYFGPDYYNGFDSKLRQTEKAKNGYATNTTGLKRGEEWELVEGEWVAELLREPLAWLGLADLGLNEQGRPVAFRLTALGRAVLLNQPTEAEQAAAAQAQQLAAVAPDMNKALLVQPNFDLMVLAPLQHQPLLRQVDRFANQASLGDVAMYRITKDSALRGMRGGLTGAEILQTLNENSRVPVASNIITTIQGWAAEFERLVLYENASLLETPTAELLDRLLAHKEGSRLIIERLGPTFALIKGDPSRLDGPLYQLQREMSGPTKKEALPLYLEYNRIQPGTITVEGERTIKIKPYSGNPYVYYRIGQFADLVAWDAATLSATFQLSAQAGRRAQQTGLTYQNAVYILKTWMQSERTGRGGAFIRTPPLPAEMELALKGWLGYYSPLVAEKALTVQVTQSSQLEEIFGIKEFEAALIGKAGPRTFLVRESHFPALRARLAGWGMPIYAPDFDPPALPSPEPEIVVAEVVEEVKPGKRTKAKPKAPPKPKETIAERERKRREESEVTASTNPLTRILMGGPAAAPPDFLQFLQALSGGSILLDDVDDDDDFEEDLPPRPPRGRFR